ncbi:MAG TPA: type 1 glutamine amidotransferase domain-containing protein [Anaeromyxobacter sp.]|nr:type 1 glutamine amidotransferase domain-containing protein [Anaeromyxobacter sp.]
MNLEGKKAALLVEDDYQELEAWYPLLRLREEGVSVIVVGTGAKSTYASKRGYLITADCAASAVDPGSLDAVIVPGGFAPDRMRQCEAMVALVRSVFQRGKIVAAICHGGWMLCSAGLARGKRVTGWPSIRDDVRNAGGEWVEDREVVRDGNVITARAPADLPAFGREIVRALREA